MEIWMYCLLFILKVQRVWYENDGEGNFEREQYITLQAVGAENVYAADLDPRRGFGCSTSFC